MSLARRGGPWLLAVLLAAGCASFLDLDNLQYEDAAVSGSVSANGAAGTGAVSGQAGDGGAGAIGGAGGAGATGGMAGTGATGGTCVGPAGAGGAGGSGGSTGGFAACDSLAGSPAITFDACGCDGDVATASDSFDSGWTDYCSVLRGSDPDGAIEITGGQAILRTSCSAWYEQGFGPFLYKRFTGDFAVTTYVKITTAGGGIPAQDNHGGGLLMREPNAAYGTGSDTWMLLTANRDSGMVLGVQLFHDTAGTVTAGSNQNGASEMGLGLCRKGTTVRAFVDEDTGWYELSSVPTAFGQTMEVGLAATAFQGNGLAIATFEYLNFGAPGSDCLETI